MLRTGAVLVVAAAAALAAPDLDVGLDPGRPFDYIKVPKDTPTGGGRKDAESQSGGKPAPAGKAGETVAEDLEKKKKEEPPPKPPSDLPGVQAPSTIDWATHINWTPRDDIVEWKDPMEPPRPSTPTGPAPQPPPAKGPEIWNLAGYPPKVSNDLYVYCATRFMQVMIHRPQVNPSELTQLLIDMDYPAYYAATAVKADTGLKVMTDPILQLVGPMVKTPPHKPEGELRQRVYMDLLLKYPYDSGFGSYILAQPSGQTLPVLLHIIQNEKHPFLVRNAVFILRCFNNSEVVEPLYKLLTTTKDGVIRNRALIALVRWGHPGAAKWCGARLGGTDTFRALAVWAIGRVALVSPIDPETVGRVIASAQNVDAFGEFLLSAAPTLGQIGRGADPETRKKIEGALLSLLRTTAAIRNPDSQGATDRMGTITPDPAGVRGKIVEERIRIALALLGNAEQRAWMQSARGGVHVTNRTLIDEAQDLIRDEKGR